MDKPNVNLFFKRSLFFITIVFLSFSPMQQTYASAVPVVQEFSTKNKTSTIKKVQRNKIKAQHSQQHSNKKKKLSLRQAQGKKKTAEKGFGWGWILLIWYMAFVAMLIVGIVLSIAALWITAVVFLSLPLLVVLVFLIIFLVALSKDGISLC